MVATKALRSLNKKLDAAPFQERSPAANVQRVSGNLRTGLILLLIGLIVGIFSGLIGTIIALIGVIFIVLWLLDEL